MNKQQKHAFDTLRKIMDEAGISASKFNDFVDPKMMQGHNSAFCWLHGGPKDCLGRLHKISSNLYDADGNELTDENIYTTKIYFKCKCDKCGHETFLTYDPDSPVIYF